MLICNEPILLCMVGHCLHNEHFSTIHQLPRNVFPVSSFSFSNFALYHIGEQKKTTIKRTRGASKFLNKENKSKLDKLEISR